MLKMRNQGEMKEKIQKKNKKTKKQKNKKTKTKTKKSHDDKGANLGKQSLHLF